MAKRAAENDGNAEKQKRFRFPQGTELAQIFMEMDSGMVVRDNTDALNFFSKLTLFTRPTQLGKSTLLALAELVYSKKQKAPDNIATNVPPDRRNAGFVIRFDFLNVLYGNTTQSWQKDLKNIDAALCKYVKECFSEFIKKHGELREHLPEQEAAPLAGDYVRWLTMAVEAYAEQNQSTEFLMVLVDEYDKPIRETLFQLLNQFSKTNVVGHCKNYVSFFKACKVVGQSKLKNTVWVTGVLPLALDLISEFKPQNMTFDAELLDSLGLREEDVDKMLDLVDGEEPFAGQQKDQVRKAIKDHANHLQFLSSTPLYHTRMVNELMNLLSTKKRREKWLRDLSKLPGTVTREDAPGEVYNVLRHSKVCREIAKELVAGVVGGELNENLNLLDVANAEISKDSYLTLLVHLGIASVDYSPHGKGHIFRSTSRHFRSKYLNEMLKVTLLPLIEAKTVQEIYAQQGLLQEFMETLAIVSGGMSRMIDWAAEKGNHILELQFQGFLVGELHRHFMDDIDKKQGHGVLTTQEDKVGKGRTDVRVKGKGTMLILELKQKSTETTEPTEAEMLNHHKQLHGYMKEVSGARPDLLVAGFVVVMYANGTKFRIEKTTYI